MLPILVLPGLMFTILLMLPFIEAWITGDKREHHLLERPRNAPTRTAADGRADDVLRPASGSPAATTSSRSRCTLSHQPDHLLHARSRSSSARCIAFIITRRWCISLQRKDNETLLHGYETGIIMRSPEGGYSERHLPLARVARLHAHRARPRPGARRRPTGGRRERRRRAPNGRLAAAAARLSTFWYADNVQKPTPEELEEGHHHAEHEHELQAPMDGHAADGHQFDGHHLVEDETCATSRSSRPASHAASGTPQSAERSDVPGGPVTCLPRRPEQCGSTARRCVEPARGQLRAEPCLYSRTIVPVAVAVVEVRGRCRCTRRRRRGGSWRRASAAFAVLMPVQPWQTLA